MGNAEIEKSIKEALVGLLETKAVAEVSVSELARAAHVARGTFYKRYPDVAAVYADVVRDTLDSCRSVFEQIACIRCVSETDRPEFCELAGRSKRDAAIIGDRAFLPTMLGIEDFRNRRHFNELAGRLGLTPAQARAVFTFQSCGCYSLIASGQALEDGWTESREAVDCFIAGGLAALTARYSS